MLLSFHRSMKLRDTVVMKTLTTRMVTQCVGLRTRGLLSHPSSEVGVIIPIIQLRKLRLQVWTSSITPPSPHS